MYNTIGSINFMRKYNKDTKKTVTNINIYVICVLNRAEQYYKL